MSDNRKENRVYLDWAAATPLLPEAKVAMEPFLAEEYGNPSAVHQEGARARLAVETARADVARAIYVRPESVTFTGSGTEANNIAIFGIIEALRQNNQHLSDIEVVTTRIEHPSVYRAMHRLEQMGVTVRYVNVTETGAVDLADLHEVLNERTRLVSLSYVNSEIGTIQPLHTIRKAIKKVEDANATEIFLHVDAAQAPLWVTCQFDTLGADVVTFDFGKCRGPKGVGALVRSRRVNIAPTVFGGGQEAGLRPGTESVAGVVAAGAAFRWAQAEYKKRSEQVQVVRDETVQLLNEIEGVVLNGADKNDRVANNINISLPGLDTEYTAVALDVAGFAVSTKSACSGAGGGESLVVSETTGDSTRASSTLRLTLGPDTTLEDMKGLITALKNHIEMMKGVS